MVLDKLRARGRLVEVDSAMMETKVFLEGTAPLLMHNVEAANPLHPVAVRMKELNALKRRKGADTEAVLAEMAEVELRGGAYYNKTLGFYLPGRVLNAALKGGARLSRNGKDIERGVMPSRDVPLLFNGPQTLDALVHDHDFIYAAMVVVGQSKVMRHRFMFAEWGIETSFVHDAAIVDRDTLLSALAATGAYVGLGDGRPLGFGRFKAYHLNE